jgi:biotin carboxyl carrier protein
MRSKVRLNDEEREVEVVRVGNRLRIDYDGVPREARLIHQDGAHFVLEVEEPGPDGFIIRRRIRAAGSRAGDRRQLWANGRHVQYELVREGRPAPAAGDEGSLSASIPAVVSEVLVKAGDDVQQGDRLILLESMKMILPIQAPRDGRIAAVHCRPGDAVQPGVPLVTLE